MIALIAAAVATAAPLPHGPPASPIPTLMPVHSVSTDRLGVTLSLQPDGCSTTKSDFTVAISKSAERPTILIARRNRANSLVLCHAQPHTVEITWSYDDLGLKPGQPFSLANPLVMAP